MIFIVLLVVISLLAATNGAEILIAPSLLSCPTTGPYHKKCYTLDDITNSNILTNANSIHLKFVPGKHLLSQDLHLSQFEAVSFMREESIFALETSITIECTDRSHIKFRYINNVTIKDVHIIGCGRSTIPLSAFHFNDVHTIILDRLHFSDCQHSVSTFVHENNFVHFHISHSTFERTLTSLSFDNKPFSRRKSTAAIHITDCTFKDTLVSNTTIHKLRSTNDSDVGGIHLRSHVMEVELMVNNCIFKNISTTALAIRESRTENIKIHNSMFQDNDISFAPVLYISCASYYCSKHLGSILIAHSTFTGNYRSTTTGTNTAVLHFNTLFGGKLHCKNINISNNSLTGLLLVGTNVVFSGEKNYFINNKSPRNAGGMYITGLNYFEVKHSKVFFINNTSEWNGGGIFVLTTPMFFSRIGYNLCTFQSTMNNHGKHWIVFAGNKAAMAGDAVYGGRYFNCKMIRGKLAFSRSSSNIPSCPIVDKYWNTTHQYNYSIVATTPVKVCKCHNDSIDFASSNLTVRAYPGVMFSISLISIGNCRGVSSGLIVTTIKNGTLSTNSNYNQYTELKCKKFYFASQPFNDSNTTTLYIETATSDDSWKNTNRLVVHVNYLPCPFGFEYSKAHRLCTCHQNITKHYHEAQCNLNTTRNGVYTSKFFTPGNFWLKYDIENTCIIAHPTCPYDYCHSKPLILTNITAPNSQCQYNRSGLLCGQCKPGLSVLLGSNKCGHCSNASIAYMSMFMLAGVLLVSFLIITNMTVSSGTINGLLFYANMVKLNETLFFNHGKVPVISQFISWLNLDWGIETCFINGLDGYWKTWLQFAFPLYIWLLVVTIIIGCRYSFRLSKVFGNNIVPVLATLFVMSYSKLLLTVTKALSFTDIVCGENQWKAWLVDSNVTYLSYKHIPLFIASIAVLVIGFSYTFVVFFAPWLQRYSSFCFRKSSRDPIVKLKPLIDAYVGPYQENYRYWTGLLLLIRLFLTPLFSYTTGSLFSINNYVLTLVVIVLSVGIGRCPYRKKPLNYLEAVYYINLSALALANSCLRDNGLNVSVNIETVLSVSVAMVTFAATVFVQMYLKVTKKCKKTSYNRATGASQKQMSITSDEMNFSPTLAHREPLIFD